MVFKKGGTFENRNGYVEKSIENCLRYYVAGNLTDNKAFDYYKEIRKKIIKN